MRSIMAVALLAGFLDAHVSLWAHPGDDGHTHEKPANVRLWKDADGLFELEASFVIAKDDKVLLTRLDGSKMWIPLSRLSNPDREWIAQRQAEIQVLNELHFGLPVNESTTNSSTETAASLSSTPWLALGAIAGMTGIGFLVRGRRRVAMPLALVVFAPLSMLFACSGVPETQEKPAANDGPQPPIVAHFQAFKEKLKFRWNEQTLFIDSNGLPDHPMMVGITAWQQQVPLPHPYAGANAWQIPLKPKMADQPISAKKALFRGAIALAVNGVPIFNALNNRGEDAFLIGELDEYGGHCGRADDYHYHAAPLHLQKIVGQGNPIGYALDGFPLYGLTDQKLDEFNGRFDYKGNYRYYSTKTYPYINGGLKGMVKVSDDAVDPQPRAAGVRQALPPLRGAKITAFTVDDMKKKYALTYEVNGKAHKINYSINDNGSVTFVFTDDGGNQETETFTRREQKGNEKKDDKKKKGKGPAK